MRVIIAEDEIDIAKALKYVLERNKFTVDMCHDGKTCLEYIAYQEYDVIVLDIMMPKMNGLEVLKEIRNKNINTPVMILSAKSEVEDRVKGLDLGADDYLPKPFSTVEFLARIKALTRRTGQFHSNLKTIGNTTFNSDMYSISTNDGIENLNNKEYQLMDLFISYPKVVFSTEKIMEKIWDSDSNAGVDVVWTYIGFLRRKLRNINSNIEIKTVRGAGYSLEIRND